MRTVSAGALRIAQPLYDFIEHYALPGTGISAAHFWAALEAVLRELTPRNRELLATRSSLQRQIDAWHQKHLGRPHDAAAYRGFLEAIGYIVPEGEPFTITTSAVDPEIATIAGPQLVVPATNARYALNALNARWGSLYDALYGTDVIPEEDGAQRTPAYNPVRGAKVMAFAAAFLDTALPLVGASHAEVTQYRVQERDGRFTLEVETAHGPTVLADPAAFVGFAPG